MDREILFRGKVSGKRLNKGEWIEGNLVHQLDCYGKPCDKYFILNKYDTNDYEIGEPIQVDPATVGQFTGLVDKNGVRIFEGDIVRFSEWSGGEFCWIGTVFYKFCSFTVEGGASKECDGDFAFPLSRIPSKRIEIIGNIHDTSELAKGEAE